LALYVSADIGGTFTDFVVLDSEGPTLETFKVFTTYPDRSKGLLEGLDKAASLRGRSPTDIALFSHGSTVGTNALVENKGARVGILTTHGFRDLLELRRQKRPQLYDLHADKPKPLVPRRFRREVRERVLYDGTVLRPLEEADVEEALAELRAHDVEAIVVMYLNAYANPAHERRTKELIHSLAPDLDVFASTDVVPQFREFERLSTAVVNAYVSPAIRTYLAGMQAHLGELRCPALPLVMKSDGGVSSPSDIVRAAVRTIGSGPAGGVHGAQLAARRAGTPENLITFDMGGTSTDVSLVIDSRALMTDSREVGGWPIRGVATDIESIGAGGGSIAWIDGGGLLRVGPHSAGSTPGPACYDRGGNEPTITDANLVLGRLDALLGGAYRLNRDLAEDAIRRKIAEPLGMSVEEASQGILSVATAQMEQAIRLITVERGHDPREFVLVAFGGAGALHAAEVARNLGIARVLVPDNCGVLSAFGVLASNITNDFSVTRVLPLDDIGLSRALPLVEDLRAQVHRWAGEQAILLTTAKIEFSADMRCQGQNHELSVPMRDPSGLQDSGHSALIAEVADGFHAAHEFAYGYSFRGAPLECVTFRARIVAPSPAKIPVVSMPSAGASTADHAASTRNVQWERGAGFAETRVCVPGDVREHGVIGPAIIERADSTILVWPGQVARSAEGGGIWIEAAGTQ